MDPEGEMYACSALVIGAFMLAEEIRVGENTPQRTARSKWVHGWLLEREHVVVLPHYIKSCAWTRQGHTDLLISSSAAH